MSSVMMTAGLILAIIITYLMGYMHGFMDCLKKGIQEFTRALRAFQKEVKTAMHKWSNADDAAHNLIFDWMARNNNAYFDNVRYRAFYHEDRLYSVYDYEKETITLVFADSKMDAIDKVMEGITDDTGTGAV